MVIPAFTFSNYFFSSHSVSEIPWAHNNNNNKISEAVRVAIGLRLGLELCVPHQCHYGAQVDAFGRHAFVCKKAAGRFGTGL